MLSVSKKDQYAIRAIFELAKHIGQGPRKISDIARAQGIPLRFLEVILGQLKGSGLVDSKRGFTGGYFLVQPPQQITIGDILRYLQGESSNLPDDCAVCISKRDCPNRGKCSFASMWNRVRQAVFQIYDQTTIEDLLADEKRKHALPSNPIGDNRSPTTRMQP